MIVAYIPLLLALIGVLMMALSSNAKLARIGEIMFFCGFLVTMMTVAKMTFRLG